MHSPLLPSVLSLVQFNLPDLAFFPQTQSRHSHSTASIGAHFTHEETEKCPASLGDVKWVEPTLGTGWPLL